MLTRHRPVLYLLAMVVLLSGGGAAAEPRTVVLGTATPGGGFPVYGQAVAETVNAIEPAVRVETRNTKGSTENVPMLEALARKLGAYRGRVRLLAVTGASNVTGYINPVHDWARMAHAAGAEIAVDAAQLAPHRPIDMRPSGDPEHLDYYGDMEHVFESYLQFIHRVPFYGLNNMFGQIPIVGLFLGGGSNEGLIGVTYEVVGTLAYIAPERLAAEHPAAQPAGPGDPWADSRTPN